MRRALVIATVAALAVARPETYKEKEDFQYSRSSSDEGKKSGFYGAQRGNMGGNYERSHNMDELAQHQMGGLVRTVDGELGDGAKQKSGSVFSSASSRGVYGSGHYDLSNLQGRNFQEGTTLADSQSRSSLSSNQAGYGSQSQSYSSAANSAYGSQSQNTRYRGYGYNTGSADQALYANNMQSADNLQSASQHEGALSSHSSGYQSQSGYQGQSVYDQTDASHHSSNAYGTSGTHGSHYRLVGASPVRVYVRPGSTIAIPVAAQSYDASQGSASIYDQNSQISGTHFNQNSINSETEVLGTDQQSAYRPTNDAKHYEASYSYRKQWEKHNTVTSVPLALPTVTPYPSNSELYEDAQAHGSEQREAQEARNVQSSSQYRGYNTKSASSRHQSAYNSLAHEHSSSSDTATASSSSANTHGVYNNGASADLNSANLNSQVEDFGSKPKSYQSSYSYHKSWERQGDPYVIKPSTNGLYSAADLQASQRLTSSSLNQASGYDSHYRQGQQGYNTYDPNCDCDENGHIRVARSYNPGHDRRSYQQSQSINEGQEHGDQQSQNLEDFGQQSQNLEDLGQQSQKLEDFNQLSQNLHDFGQQSQNLEELGQQSQNLQSFGQETQNLEDFGQQSQNLHELGQESQKLEDFGQQTQDAGQLMQNFDRIEDLGQQAQNQWDQQSQTEADQQTQNTWSMLETIQHNHAHGSNDNAQHSNEMDHTGSSHHITNTAFETQPNVFEINHPSLNKPESHTTQEDKVNPFAHTIFNEHHSDQEKPDLGKDTEKEFPQLDLGRHPGQQTQVYWQSFPPSMNQNNQNVYVPMSPLDVDRVRQDFPDWQKYLEAHNMHTDYGQNQHHHYQTVYGASTGMYQTSYSYNPRTQSAGHENTGYAKPMVFPSSYGHNPTRQYPENVDAGFGPNSWMFTQSYSHNPSPNIQNPENTNAFTNTQNYITHNNQSAYSTGTVNLVHESGSTSLTNLWGLIDDIEKQTIPEKEAENSYHTYQENKEDVQSNNNSDLTRNFSENTFSNEGKVQQSIAQLPSTTESNVQSTTTKQDNSRPHFIQRGDIEPDKQKPQEEAGRGDISPEDNDESNPNQPLEILEISPTKPTINRTPEEIGILSLIRDNNKTTLVNSDSAEVEKQISLEQNDKQFESELGVLSLDAQKKLEHHSEQDNLKLQSDIHRATTPKSNYHYEYPQFNVEQDIQQNVDQSHRQHENTEQQNYNQFENVDQQNTDLHLVDFGKQGENLRQERDFESFYHQNISVDQHSLEHHHQEVQQNMEQQFETLGQQTEDLNQQSLNQFEDFGQQSENLGQEHQNPDNFGQQSEGFQQENLGELGQQSENLGQEHQHPDNFGQQSEGFQQESFGELGQQSENLGQEHQHPDNFGQQSEGFQQESIGELGQQSENLGQEHQQPDNFGQQSEGFQQESLGDFGQHEQFQQESLSNFEHQSENIDHFKKDQEQENRQEHENLEQQSQSEDLWKPMSKQQTSQVETFVPISTFNKESRALPQSEPVFEPEVVTQKTSNVDTPPESVTEKIGFWKSAKDKVKSWFSRS